jgi:ATP-dependent Clp protease ATP-binding subunit ClpA
MGFNRGKREGDDQDAIQKMFTPEFRNRLDAVVAFSNLPQDVILKVVEKFIFQLEAQLADRGVTIELTEAASKWIAEKGYDEKFGARPLARVIQEYIKKPLADELLFGKLEHGGTVKIDAVGIGADAKLEFELIAGEAVSTKAREEDEDEDGDAGEPETALIEAAPRSKALPAPPTRRGRSSGTVPTVPPKKD